MVHEYSMSRKVEAKYSIWLIQFLPKYRGCFQDQRYYENEKNLTPTLWFRLKKTYFSGPCLQSYLRVYISKSCTDINPRHPKTEENLYCNILLSSPFLFWLISWNPARKVAIPTDMSCYTFIYTYTQRTWEHSARFIEYHWKRIRRTGKGDISWTMDSNTLSFSPPLWFLFRTK